MFKKFQMNSSNGYVLFGGSLLCVSVRSGLTVKRRASTSRSTHARRGIGRSRGNKAMPSGRAPRSLGLKGERCKSVLINCKDPLLSPEAKVRESSYLSGWY